MESLSKQRGPWITAVALCYMMILNLPNNTSSKDTAGQVKFCFNNTLYSFETKLCSGGIRFAHQPVRAENDCYCLHGRFMTVGEPFGSSFSVISNEKMKCSTQDDSNAILRDQNYINLDTDSTSKRHHCFNESFLKKWHIIPLWNATGPLRTSISLWDTNSFENLPNFNKLRFYTVPENSEFFIINETDFNGSFSVSKSGYSQGLRTVKISNMTFDLKLNAGDTLIFAAIDPSNKLTIKPQSFSSTSSSGTCAISPDCKEEPYSVAKLPLIRNPKQYWHDLSQEEVSKNLLNEELQLIEYGMRMKKQGARIKEQNPSQRLQILNITQRILQKSLEQVVPSSVIETTFRMFHYLYYDVDTESNLRDPQFVQIMYDLNLCLEHTRPMTFMYSGCPVKLEKYVVTLGNGTTIITVADTPDDRKYNEAENDPIVEMMWKAVDFVHSVCFDYFESYLNLHHYFENEMDKLFLLQPVQYRWFRKLHNGIGRFQRIIPKLTLLLMHNIEFAVGAIFQPPTYTYNYWLRKPRIDFGELNEAASENLDNYVDPKDPDPFKEYRIWNGLAYCLQLNASSTNKGLSPSLLDIRTHFNDTGPTQCEYEVS